MNEAGAVWTALAWPFALLCVGIIAIYVFHHLGHAWLKIIATERVRAPSDPWLEMNVNVGTVKAVAKVAAATVAIHYLKGSKDRVNERMIDELIRTLTLQVSRPTARQAFSALSILWVHQLDDDDVFEKQAFETLGASVQFVKSTDDALTELARKSYNCVISNLKRPNDPAQDASRPVKGYAGFALYKRIRKEPAYKSLQFIIYSRSLDEESRSHGSSIGIVEMTNDPMMLFEFVLSHATAISAANERLPEPVRSAL